jgi:O-glycosyl hydrolase
MVGGHILKIVQAMDARKTNKPRLGVSPVGVSETGAWARSHYADNPIIRWAAMFLLSLAMPALAGAARAGPIRWWVSSEDMAQQLTEQPALAWQTETNAVGPRLEINLESAYQTMLGLGSSLEPATCWNLSLLPAADLARTLERLLNPTSGIGMNLMRICIGSPDFTGDVWYSYNDLPPGDTDPALRRFTIDKDRVYILPVLKQARAMNSNLLFFASPWSPPAWMKSTNTLTGGELLPRWYSVYAEYLVMFIRAYEAEGILIYAITVQNEPGVDRAKEKDPQWRYPSCHWTGEQERDFIRDHLGPAFRRYGVTTRIWCYDHNYNVQTQGDSPGLTYPRTILEDARAAQYVGGVAFHGYEGDPSGMSVLHSEFPQMPVHFTEGSVFALKGGVELIEKLRHHASSYNAWVTILDDRGKPNNGPFEASPTIITIDVKTGKPKEHFDYFLYGQFMKFIQRGAVRLSTGPIDGMLAHVAFRNPDGSIVLVAINPADRTQRRIVIAAHRGFVVSIPAKSAATFVFYP